MKTKNVVLVLLTTIIIMSGCSHQNDNIAGSEKTPLSNQNETSSAIAASSSVPTVDMETAVPSAAPEEGFDEREDKPVEYAEANYFKEKVKEIIYYRDGKKYTISPDSEQGKQIILMAKLRYVNTGEYVLRKNILKKQFPAIQKKGKALEIKFVKKCFKIYTGGKRNDYKKVSINYQSWFYPLEGEEAKCFMPLPNQECTYEKLGDAKQLLDYLEKCIG